MLLAEDRGALRCYLENGYYDPNDVAVPEPVRGRPYKRWDPHRDPHLDRLCAECAQIHHASWNVRKRKATAVECFRGLLSSPNPDVQLAVAVHHDDLLVILAELSL